MRINKCIDLLSRGEPVFALHTSEPPKLTYDSGRDHAAHWADMIVLEFEHFGFDIPGLANFMQGLADATPRETCTPTVVATLPLNGYSADEVRYNAWQARHALSTGIHGLMMAQARNAEAVEAFIAAARYPFQPLAADRLPDGLRGAGGEGRPSQIWGVSVEEYHRLADPWPLNPEGELLLGIKIEHNDILPQADAIARVPGVGFAEWGPADMLMSFDRPREVDPPYPPEAAQAMNRVKSALDSAGVAFHCGWSDGAMTPEQQVDYLLDVVGARILVVDSQAQANHGRNRASRSEPKPPNS